MKRIDQVFNLHRAKSDLFSKYKPGPVAYVGNGLSDNAVVGLVTPLPGDKVFKFAGIAVSAFCHCCPVKTRTESAGWDFRLNRLGSPMLPRPVKWALSRKE